MTDLPRTVMAFDFGLSQIGVAVGNTMLNTTQPLDTLRARDGIPDWQVIEAMINEWQPQLIVVGEPLHMDGSASELAARAAKFGRRLEGRFAVAVTLMDERLSSFEAKQVARDLGHNGDYKDNPVDSLAAELILKSWLASREG